MGALYIPFWSRRQWRCETWGAWRGQAGLWSGALVWFLCLPVAANWQSGWGWCARVPLGGYAFGRCDALFRGWGVFDARGVCAGWACGAWNDAGGGKMMNLLRAGGLRAVELAGSFWRRAAEIAVAVFEFRVDVVLWRGRLRAGGEDEGEVTCLYVGRRENMAHLRRRFYEDVTTVHSHRASLVTYRKHMAAAEARADVVILDVGSPYNGWINRQGNYLVIPNWVSMVVPMAETWDETVQGFRKTMRKNIRRQIRRNGYACAPTNDPAKIRAFYDDYYRAFINARYGDAVEMTPRMEIEECARKGVILEVIGADGPVSAGVYFPSGGEFCLLASGMPEALVDNPPEAAISALYYFSLEYAFEKGFKAVNFLGTRPFPDDGLYQFKRKWGAGVRDDFSIDAILLRPVAGNAAAARFCERFATLARAGAGLELVICTTAQGLGAQDYTRMVAEAHCGGVDAVRIVQVTDEGGALADCPEARLVATSLEGFAQAYVGKASGG